MHAVESNDLREVNEILQVVVDETDSQHFVLLSQSISKAQIMDADGEVQVHVGTTAAEVKHILLTVPINEGTSPLLFVIAGREFAEENSS